MRIVDRNIACLRQALALVERLDDAAYTLSPPAIAPHKAGAHVRHVLEFYECFLDGLEEGLIDYDARKRDAALERSRAAARAKIEELMERLRTVRRLNAPVQVRMEDGDALLASSAGRELQVLSSHAVHHFALIALALRGLGMAVDPEFGMAPSTLRYLEARRAPEAA
ncbi:MAG: hypothetical protein FJW37_03170 [Acidobacteria bacterium]|nr:hypothetical protein [Acidobacteriota bacterium]